MRARQAGTQGHRPLLGPTISTLDKLKFVPRYVLELNFMLDAKEAVLWRCQVVPKASLSCFGVIGLT